MILVIDTLSGHAVSCPVHCFVTQVPAASEGAGGGQSAGQGGETVEDADYEVVDDDGKKK